MWRFDRGKILPHYIWDISVITAFNNIQIWQEICCCIAAENMFVLLKPKTSRTGGFHRKQFRVRVECCLNVVLFRDAT